MESRKEKIIPELLDTMEHYQAPPDLFQDKRKPRKIKLSVILSFSAFALAAALFDVRFPVTGLAKTVPAQPVRIVQASESGILVKPHFSGGEKVREGDVLAEIRNTDILKEYKDSKVVRNMTLSRLKQLEERLEYLKLVQERNEDLYKENVIALSEMEKVKLTYNQELQQYDILKDEMSMADTKIVYFERSLKNMKVIAPVSGILLSKLEEKKGFVVQRGDEICAIANPEDIVLELPVNEKELNKVNIGDSAIIKFLAYPEHSLTGKVIKIEPTAWEKLRKALVKENVINVLIKPDHIPNSPIKLGMMAKVKIDCAKVRLRELF